MIIYMSKTLKQYENIALSNYDILKMLDKRVNIILYPNLHKYDDIDQVLGPYGACILLFEAKKRYGHWVCIFKQDNDLLEFFNSYGGYPDDSLKYIPNHYAKVSNQLVPYLSLLMDKSNYDLSYNEFQFQKKGSGTKTCGRHCVVRLMNRDKTLYEYVDYLDDICENYDCDYDEAVSMITEKII